MRALRGLDLTDTQREQVRAILRGQAGSLQERMQAARSAREELRALALSPNFDSGRARDFADAAAKAQADIAVMRAESMSKVVALLTPEQRARLEQRRQRRGRQ
jgi:Spy/CpxP family protein refolding chaperone